MYQELGDLESARQSFDAVLNRAHLYELDEPAVAKSALRRGQLADMRKDHREASRFYERAVSLAATGNEAVRAEASTLLRSRYVPKPKSKPDPALRERFVGTYAAGTGLSVEVSVSSSGVLSAKLPMGEFILVPDEGNRLKILGHDALTFDFTGSGPSSSTLTVNVAGRVFQLERKK